MTDDTQSQTPPAHGTQASSTPRMNAKKRKKAKTMRAAPSKAPAAARAASGGGLVAVYAILGLLVLFTSFYTGYLVGRQGGGEQTQEGSVETGKLQIIEYSDFQCPFCSRAVPTIEQLKQTYGDKIEVVYRNYPLEGLHPNAFGAAIAAECVREAGGDEAFWTYHDKLFANQQALDIASLKRYAGEQGLNINDCIDTQKTAAKVRADMAEAQQRGVSGTPSFWIKDELVVGAQPYAVIAAKIDEKLSGKAAPAPAPQLPSEPAAPAQPVDLEDGNYVLGKANAPVTIVEFTDFQCPFCGRAHEQTYPQIKSEYIDSGKVRYTIRNYPLPFHENAEKSAEAAECAGEQGKYWEYVDTLFAHQDALTVTNLKQYAKDLKLTSATFDTCLDSGKFAQLIEDDTQAGSAAGVSGTPSFFVNGKILVGAQPYTSFKAAIDAELQ